MAANLGCVAGIDVGRYNACTAWVTYDLPLDVEEIHFRLHDYKDSPPLSRTADRICRGYDMDAPADGTEKLLSFPIDVLSKPANELRNLITEQLLELVP